MNVVIFKESIGFNFLLYRLCRLLYSDIYESMKVLVFEYL